MFIYWGGGDSELILILSGIRYRKFVFIEGKKSQHMREHVFHVNFFVSTHYREPIRYTVCRLLRGLEEYGVSTVTTKWCNSSAWNDIVEQVFSCCSWTPLECYTHCGILWRWRSSLLLTVRHFVWNRVSRRFQCSCYLLPGDVGLCEQLWLWVALSQPPSCDGFRFYCHIFRFSVAGEDVPDLKRAGSRIDWCAITRPMPYHSAWHLYQLRCLRSVTSTKDMCLRFKMSRETSM